MGVMASSSADCGRVRVSIFALSFCALVTLALAGFEHKAFAESSDQPPPLAPTATPGDTPKPVILADAPPTLVPKSVPRRTVGQVFTIIGIAELVTGGAVGGGLTAAGWSGLVWVFVGPVVGEGFVLTSIGIPLWVSGAHGVPAQGPRQASESIEPEAYVPRIGLSGGKAVLTVPF
jgi:hypothetical protein